MLGSGKWQQYMMARGEANSNEFYYILLIFISCYSRSPDLITRYINMPVLVEYVGDKILQVVHDFRKTRHGWEAKYTDGLYYRAKSLKRGGEC